MKKSILLLILSLYFYSASFAYVTQSNWRWRDDNGSETTATWRATQNAPITIGSIDSVLRLRIQMQNNTGDDNKNFNANLMYASAPDGPWRYVTNFKGNNVFIFTSVNSHVNDLVSTTHYITGSTNQYVPGKILVKTNELDVPIINATATEYEYSIKPTDNIMPNTTYYFKIPVGDYPVTLPSLTTTANITSKATIITNGSFENGLKDWSLKVSGTATATYQIVNTIHKQGIKSLVATVTKTGKATDISLNHKSFNLTPGHTYMVRFWAYAKDNSSKMRIVLKGSKSLGYNYKLYTDWEEFQFAFKAFEPSVTLSFLCQTKTQYAIDKVEILDENNEEVDVPMNYMWQNNRPENEYSWLSADGENSELLPDGRTVWTFSDGWYGYNDTTTNSMSTHQLLRNTLVVQTTARPNGILHTTIGGTVAQPKALMTPPQPKGHDDFFWPRDFTIDNDSLKIMLPDVIQKNEGDPLTNGNRQAVGVFSLPDLTLRSIKWMPWLDTIYYIALCKADDGNTYAYGSNAQGHAVVARFPTGQLSATTPWQFLTDTGWSFNGHHNKEIADVNLYSVARLGPNNYVSLFLNALSDKIEVLYANSPIGPWVGRSIVGQTEGQANILCYFALLHEGTANNGVYTFSYSNNGGISQMLDDKTVYWPSFLKADLKSLSPFNNGSPLPVKLLNFTASAENRQVLVQWETATETNNDHFIIERSADGRNNWTAIATLKSKGNSMDAQIYNTYDKQPLNGENYYRLKQVDKDGQVNLSNIRSVTLKLINPIAKAFPNPSRGDLYFSLENYTGTSVQVQLSNMNGRQLLNETIPVQAEKKYKLPLLNKPAAGVYNLMIKGDDLDQLIKIVIQ